jgi:hypothetical protein
VRHLPKLLSVPFFLLGGMFLIFGFQRSQLPYNEEGRYFDPIEGVVHDTDAVVALNFLGIIFMALGLIVFAQTWWYAKRDQKESELESYLQKERFRVRPTPDEITKAQKEIVTLYNQLFQRNVSELSEVAASSNDKLIKLLEELESQTLVVAIMESPERLQNSFLSQLHPRAQQVMREEIELLKQSPRL